MDHSASLLHPRDCSLLCLQQNGDIDLTSSIICSSFLLGSSMAEDCISRKQTEYKARGGNCWKQGLG